MKNEMIKLGLAFALGMSATVHAADACALKDTLFQGEAHLVTFNNTAPISRTQLGYSLWFAESNDSNDKSLTYHDNGLFKAEWNDTQDFWARVGLTYDATNGIRHDYKKLSLSYNYTKTVESGSVFIGVYGWTVNPAGEFFIVDDWIAQIDEAHVGRKFGEYEVDGSKYAVYALMTDEGESWRGYPYRVMFTSVRETPRECGYIDITAHFNKFDELFTGQTDTIPNARGVRKNAVLKFGNLTDLMATVEAFDNGKGSIDYAHIRFGELYAEESSSSAAPGSSATAPESSAAAPESPAAGSSSSVVSPDSGSTAPANHAEPAEPSSSDASVESSDGKKGTDALPVEVRAFDKPGTYQVFDMQGRVLGQVFVPAGVAVNSAIFAKFGKSGVYMVQSDGGLKVLSVTK
ncbi:MAG: glycoside hydrolase family 11 protein [Fibrobacter sp.]|nr:glycoside hydrolase family 11 protein [Fibrobacter sp.]